MDFSVEERIILILMFAGYIWCIYYAYLAWKKPDSFRSMAEKSLGLYGNSQAMKEWFHTQSYIWLARILLLLPVGVLTLLFGSVLWAWVVLMVAKIHNLWTSGLGL